MIPSYVTRIVALLLACSTFLSARGELLAQDNSPQAGAGSAAESHLYRGPDSDRPVVVLTTYLASPAYMTKLREAARRASLPLVVLKSEEASESQLREALARATLLLIDVQHPSVAKQVADKFGEAIVESNVPYVTMGALESIDIADATFSEPLQSRRDLAVAWAQRLAEYFRYGGKRNTDALIQLLGSKAESAEAALVGAPAPQIVPEEGFYHPTWEKLETELAEVLKKSRRDGRPLVAISINRLSITSDDVGWLERLTAALDARGVDSYAFYGARNNPRRFTQAVCLPGESDERPVVDLIITAGLTTRPNERQTELNRLGVPVLQTLPSLLMDEAEWRSSKEGLAIADVSFYLTTSELAGMVDPVMIAARNHTTGALDPILDQIEAVGDKAAALCKLRRTPRAEKRVAVVVYNYPQGENNFGASFLNVPKSLVNLLTAMKSGGYATEPLPAEEIIVRTRESLVGFYDRAALQRQLTTGTADFLPLDVYVKWFERLAPENRARITGYWGEPASMAIAAPDGRLGFAIPGVKLGNVAIVPQPQRYEVTSATGEEARKKRISHRSTVPLSHAYFATYLWMREQFKADAVVHLGTHGTLEFAQGKERALAVTDDSMLAIGSLPNVYPYMMDNLGEGTTAKRRGRAVMISHLPPLSTPAGFRPGLHEMHNLMHDWETATGPTKAAVEKRLLQMFGEHKLDRDLDWTPDRIAADFAGFMKVLHPFLDDVAQAAQPQGLAALGDVPSDERRIGMVLQILRKPLIEELGEDIDEVFLLDYEKVRDSRPGRWLRLALRDPAAASKLDLRKLDELDSSKNTPVPNRAAAKPLDPEKLLALAQRAQTLYATLSQNQELDNLLAALDGKHIPPSYGGDPVRNPESLPTGRNIYGFDPARVPTQQAWEIGKGVFETWLAEYQSKHDGQPPEKIAFSLWAGETLRHQGIMEAQVLYALGVRPTWDEGGRVTGFEVIAHDELKRPRLDVVLSVTGSYRDQFPAVMEHINNAVRTTADLKEADNLVAAGVERMRSQLVAEGVDAGRAAKLATLRVFSNEPGAYGTGLNDVVNASDLWENKSRAGGEPEMARLFVERMGFAYGDDSADSAAQGVFARHAAEIDCVLSSRSSNTFGVLTSDDPFSYVGAFSLAGRVLGKKSPELYVENLRDESEPMIDSAERAIAKEMQSRYLHPQWIKSQQAEGYSGTLQVLKTAQFLWGWQVTAPETVREDQWQSMFDVYVRDQYKLGTREWLEQGNQAALAQILERMIDAMRLGYWKPDAQTEKELLDRFAAAMQASQLRDKNTAVVAFASARSAPVAEVKPDSSAPVAPTSPRVVSANEEPQPAQRSGPPSAEPSPVKGVKMEPEAAHQPPTTWLEVWGVRVLVLSLVGALILIGAWRQAMRFPRQRD